MNILENLTKEEIIKIAHDKIDAPFVHVGRAALSRTPIVTVCLKAKSDWDHGIMENEIYAYWHIEEDGTVENWSKFSRDLQKQRKFKVASLEAAIERINLNVQRAKKHFSIS